MWKQLPAPIAANRDQGQRLGNMMAPPDIPQGTVYQPARLSQQQLGIGFGKESLFQ
ncbi:MAG: hypothetical protein NT115_19975 [Proteobacteria bacterium]|nr:hypothetical protein [Pseudomonadota bacterium]